MRKEITVLLTLLLVLVLIYIGRYVAQKGQKRSGFLLERITPTDVAALTIIEGSDTVRLIQQDGTWRIQLDSVRTGRVNTQMIERWQKTLGETSYELASRNPEKFKTLEVTPDKAVEVIFYGPDRKVLADVLIGKLGPDYNSSYIRVKDANVVYLASANLRSLFPRKTWAWRDRNMLSFDMKDVTGLRVYLSEDSVIVSRDTLWRVQGIASPDTLQIRSLLRVLSRLTAIDFADTLTLDQAGLNPPKARVVIELSDGTEKVLKIGDPKENRGYYAQVKGDETLYVMSKYSGDLVLNFKEKVSGQKEQAQKKSGTKVRRAIAKRVEKKS